MTALSDCRTGTGVQVRPGQGPRGRHLPCEFDVVIANRRQLSFKFLQLFSCLRKRLLGLSQQTAQCARAFCWLHLCWLRRINCRSGLQFWCSLIGCLLTSLLQPTSNTANYLACAAFAVKGQHVNNSAV